MALCVCIVVRDEEGRIACSCRRQDSTVLNLPGGKLDEVDGDVLRDRSGVLRRAAVRELYEETGLVADPSELTLLHEGMCVDETGHDIASWTVAYLAPTWTGNLQAGPGEPPAKWTTWEDLLSSGAFTRYNQVVRARLKDES